MEVYLSFANWFLFMISKEFFYVHQSEEHASFLHCVDIISRVLGLYLYVRFLLVVLNEYFCSMRAVINLDLQFIFVILSS